ncbi:putative DNA primase/helicase [Nitrosospira multiformis]|uniref:Putative DNA primase/helicase n=1 Tax=Nitrosospira multiformis TaxID=1231 RepID=A0A1H8FDW3_9PROT|nr:DUF3987 domain-containing protein [Nitrosospira multiformis]SEN29785.1 putative DNA primase/helicase [Nitrosospira multiformis]
MTEISTIRDALEYISARDRGVWTRMGMAIKSELGDDGFVIWDEWSMQDASYDPKTAKITWRSFKQSGGISIGTLFHEAKTNGWRSDGTLPKPSAEGIEARRRDAAERPALHEEEEQKRQEAAKRKAASILEAATGDPSNHLYIKSKKNPPIGTWIKRGYWPQREWHDALLVPIFQADTKVWSIEAINTDGKKDSLKDGRKAGGFHPIGKIKGSKQVLIGEGISTMAACHNSTGITSVAALSAGNLKAVAEAVLGLAPDAEIIFIADNDIKADGTNVGLSAARDAAYAFHARVAIPELDGRTCDFWDIWSERGKDAVRHAIEAARTHTFSLLPHTIADVDRLGHEESDQTGQGGVNPYEPWTEPQPMAVKVEPEPYPLDALPHSIHAAVEEVAGFVKAPLPLVASSALAALSVAIQAYADIKRAEKLSGPVGLFLLTIADSGERKSTCDGFFMKAIRDYEEVQAEIAKPILKDYKAAIQAWEAKHNGIKEKIKQLAKNSKPTAEDESALRDLEQQKPEPERVPRLLYADATPEALAYGLATQWPSGGIVSAEAGIVLGSHGMGKDSVMRNLAMLNQLWDGNPLSIDRKTTDSFAVRGARLTVALQVQEPTLREFFGRSGALARGTGFLARFLTSWPESTQGFRPFTEAPENWPHLTAFNRRLADLLNQPLD